MEVNLSENIKPHGSSLLNATNSGGDAIMMGVSKEEIVKKEGNKNCTTTIASEISIANNNEDDGMLIASLPKTEVKLKKIDESKLLMDNNENSLSVDTLIEILSSTNDTKLPIVDNVKSELMNVDNDIFVPPASDPSTLNSPSSSSSASSLSKSGFNSPTATETSNNSSHSSHVPSPRTNASTPQKKFSSPHYSNGGKPMIADMNKKMKQVARRQPKPKAVYQSQISDNSVGIKLCIKKSVNTFKAMPSPNSNSSKSSRKRKSNKVATARRRESDSDDPYVKRRKKPSNSESNSTSTKGSFEEPVEQSLWGRALPKEVLIEVRSLLLTRILNDYNLSFVDFQEAY